MDVRLYTLAGDDALDSRDRVIFLKPLLPHISEKLLVIWDGSPTPKGHVRPFWAEGGARRIHLELLPADAADLNPGEGVWHHLKHGAMRNLCCLNLPHLRRELGLAIKRLWRKPHVMTGCVAQAGLSIVTSVLPAPICKQTQLPDFSAASTWLAFMRPPGRGPMKVRVMPGLVRSGNASAVSG